ncbi:MAG TPA: GvpL/GvpF family gas vesicle protein [Candidatus Limnocylindrales bacterium]|nr:GvpL/GvpF family gas vesicle protein [Candidatus Limnocylindrales bacterium]
MPTHVESRQANGNEQRTGVYIYGIVPGDVELVPDAHGIGDPSGEVTLVRHGRLAALVSEIDLGRPIGRPADLKLHEQLLDATAAADVPVVPMRFGAVMASPETVVEELLTPHHDLFAEALGELDGRVEYVVYGRFVEDAVLAQVISDNPAVASQRERLRSMPREAAVDARIELGQIVNSAIEASRDRETAKLIDTLDPLVLAEAVRPPTSELDAFHVAFLVELDRTDEFGDAVEKLAAESDALIEVRMRGPLAAFDFMMTSKPNGN